MANKNEKGVGKRTAHLHPDGNWKESFFYSLIKINELCISTDFPPCHTRKFEGRLKVMLRAFAGMIIFIFYNNPTGGPPEW